MVQYRKEEQGWRGRSFGEAGSNQSNISGLMTTEWNVECHVQQKALRQLLLLPKSLWKAPEAYLSLHANVASQQGLFVWSHKTECADLMRMRRNRCEAEDGGGGAHRSKSAIKHRSSLPVFNVKVWQITCWRSAAPVSVGKLVHWWLAHSWMKKCNPA